MTCQIEWIDCKGNETGHDAPAVATVSNHGQSFRCCQEHLDTLRADRVHHDATCDHKAFQTMIRPGAWSATVDSPNTCPMCSSSNINHFDPDGTDPWECLDCGGAFAWPPPTGIRWEVTNAAGKPVGQYYSRDDAEVQIRGKVGWTVASVDS